MQGARKKKWGWVGKEMQQAKKNQAKTAVNQFNGNVIVKIFSWLKIFQTTCSLFNFYFSLSYGHYHDLKQRKVKNKLVWEMFKQGNVLTTTATRRGCQLNLSVATPHVNEHVSGYHVLLELMCINVLNCILTFFASSCSVFFSDCFVSLGQKLMVQVFCSW